MAFTSPSNAAFNEAAAPIIAALEDVIDRTTALEALGMGVPGPQGPSGADGQDGADAGTIVKLAADVVNANAVANTLDDCGNLSFDGAANTAYRVIAHIAYTAAATTTGSRWVLDAPAGSSANLRSAWTFTATSETVNTGVGLNQPAAANEGSGAVSNTAHIVGTVTVGATPGTVKVRFASEVANSAITAKAGLSWLEYRPI